MKTIILFLLISISGSIFAINPNSTLLGLSMQTSPIIIQKALDSGIAFKSNQSEYQLILGGKAYTNRTKKMSSNSNVSNVWTGQNGSYELSIDGNVTAANSASISPSGNSFNQIAYNPRSGGVGIITGDIIVKLKSYYSANSIASSFNINLVNNFEDINTVIFRVNLGQNIFIVANKLSAYPGVEFAEIDVIENFPVAN